MSTTQRPRAASTFPLKLVTTSPATVTSPGRPAATTDARWVEVVRYAALAVFAGLIALSVWLPNLAGRIVWTVAIASLPLFFVVAGYHRWRRICPLAFIAQVPTFLGRAGHKRAGRWLQAHGYRLPFFVFHVSLWLRLVATNGDGYAIAIFLAAISLAAFAVGLIFTGKTWCNYVCPVSFVERLYTDPRGLTDTPNSQCHKCTACRPACPDINQENTYWKEILLADKRYVFFAFPGVVLGFYTYYYVQAGSWDYYFGGRWTHEIGLVRTAFLPGSDAATAGAYFWPEIPRAVAAAVTLLLGAGLSVALFSLLEQRVRASARRRHSVVDRPLARHMVFSLAAFIGFVAFYSFAGAPTLRLVAGVPHVFQLAVVTIGTLMLVRRIGRRQRDFAEETLARKIVAKWPWAESPPRDLQEALRIHSVLSESAQNALGDMIGRYKSAVRESIYSGVLSRADVHRLDSLRTKLRITETEHERVMAELVDEERDLIIGGKAYASPEKQLQLKTYAEALAALLEQQAAMSAPLEDEIIRRLREEHEMTVVEHRAVLDHLVRSRDGIATHVLDTPAVIEITAASMRDIEELRSSVSRFLSAVLWRRWNRAVETLLEAVGAGDERSQTLRDGLLARDPARRRAAVVDLASRFPPATAARLVDALDHVARDTRSQPDIARTLRLQLTSPDPYVRATAIYMLESAGQSSDADRELLANDEHPLVRETLAQAHVVATGGTVAEPSTLEKMIALRSIGIFETLEPEDLIRLARASTEAWFSRDEVLCHEGEMGDEVYVLLAGEVSVRRKYGDGVRILAVEGAGACIGELSVLDSAPREATVIASSIAVRALRLNGRSFHEATHASPAMSDSIVRLLARRLRAVGAVSESESARRDTREESTSGPVEPPAI